MKLRNLLLASTFAFTGAAFAQADTVPASEATMSYSDSEYLHQAPAGKFELTPGVGIKTQTVEIKASPASVRVADFFAAVKAEYGFGDMFSLSGIAAIAGGNSSVEDCPSSSTCAKDTHKGGLVNPVVSANFRFPIGMSVIRAGLDFAFSLGDQKYGNFDHSNYYTGGSTLSPYVGYEITFGRNILGARVSYQVLSTNRDVRDKDGKKYTEKEGEELTEAIFYEHNFPKVVSLGVAIEHTRGADTKDNSSGTYEKFNDGYDKTGVAVYVPLRFNDGITLIPRMTAGAYDHDSMGLIDSHTFVDLTCDARFTF